MQPILYILNLQQPNAGKSEPKDVPVLSVYSDLPSSEPPLEISLATSSAYSVIF